MTATPSSVTEWFDTLSRLAESACAAEDPEAMIRALIAPVIGIAGDRDAWQRPGSLKPGERQYYVGGCFVVTPDEAWHMLIGNVGFPAEQRRLMIPIDGGHPARVRQSRKALLLANTDEHGDFKQYLKSSRMGSSMHTCILWNNTSLIQRIICCRSVRQKLFFPH